MGSVQQRLSLGWGSVLLLSGLWASTGGGCASWPTPATTEGVPGGQGLVVARVRVTDGAGADLTHPSALVIAGRAGGWDAVPVGAGGWLRVALPPGEYSIANVQTPLVEAMGTTELAFSVRAGTVSYLGEVAATFQAPAALVAGLQRRAPLVVSTRSQLARDRAEVERVARRWPIVDEAAMPHPVAPDRRGLFPPPRPYITDGVGAAPAR
jgi:hypothetical protein